MSRNTTNYIELYLPNSENWIYPQEIIANRKSTQWEVRSQPLDNIAKINKDIEHFIARIGMIEQARSHLEKENRKIQLLTISNI